MSIIEHIRNGTGISSVISERGEDLLDAVEAVYPEAADLLVAATVAEGRERKAALREEAARLLESWLCREVAS